MKHIVYVSQAVKPFDSDELAQLLEHSQARNLEDDITGLLIYRYNADFKRGNFVQALEGPVEAIDEVWSRIANDDRHHTIVVVEEGDIESRTFGLWSMGFRNVNADDLKGFEGFVNLGSDEFWERANSETVSEAVELLKSFYDGI